MEKIWLPGNWLLAVGGLSLRKNAQKQPKIKGNFRRNAKWKVLATDGIGTFLHVCSIIHDSWFMWNIVEWMIELRRFSSVDGPNFKSRGKHWCWIIRLSSVPGGFYLHLASSLRLSTGGGPVFSLFGRVTSSWTLMSVCWLVRLLVGLS